MLYPLLLSQAARFPRNVAIVHKDERITYRRLAQMSARLARSLHAMGFADGDAVALVSENRPEFVIAFFAFARLNARLVPVNPASSPQELVRIFDSCGVGWIMADGPRMETCASLASGLKRSPALLALDGGAESASSFRSLIRDHSREKLPSGEGGDGIPLEPGAGEFIVLFSSGSTGRPKRLARTQAAYAFELEGFAKAVRVTARDRNLCAIPLYHSHGIGSCLLPSIGTGSTLVLLEADVASPSGLAANALFLRRLPRVLELMEKERITLFPAIPYIFQALLEHPGARREAFGNIRFCFSSGNFLSRDIHDAFLARFGIRVCQIYGCSEAGAVTIDAGAAAKGPDGSRRSRERIASAPAALPAGTPLEGTTLRIVAEDGSPCGHGQVGEIRIKSPSLTGGYLDLPEANREAFQEGFFLTGDLGRIDAGGTLTVVGRKKLIIDTGGKKVDPYEVEDALAAHPSITEAVVLGVPVSQGNEWIKAVVVAARPMTEEEVREHCRSRLASYKVPRLVEFTAAIPKSATGKILRKDMIRDGEAAEFTSRFLERIVREATAMDGAGGVDGDRSFEELGIDSATMVALNASLEKEYPGLPKTLFFECRTLRELSAFLGRLGSGAATPAPEAAVPEAPRPGREDRGLDIAIIGVSGRYPGADNLREFWDNLLAGRDCITDIPEDRWDWRAHFDADPAKPGKSYSRWGGFLAGAYEFDAALFSIPPVEAELLDPQERLFLACAWSALEEAGYSRDDFAGAPDGPFNNVGVYAGVMWGDHQLHGQTDASREAGAGLPKSHYWSIPNRVSFHFNLQGPSLAVDSACSSSLTAIHLACQGILAGDCRWAIAGGVNLILHPRRYRLMSEGRFASTDGRCRSFGEGGDGYVPAEGVGAVVLKPLLEAKHDGDHIHGIIRSTALSHGGRTKAFTAPGPKAQARVVARALARAAVPPATIGYIEAHGTGTSLGDPIELRGLGLAFRGEAASPGAKPHCAIGSVKSNIGHCEAAAGIAGLTKLLLQMKHGMMAPSLHADRINPNLDFEGSPFRLQREKAVWARIEDGAAADGTLPLRAGLSSFGAGGSNAHLILEEFPSPAPDPAPQTPRTRVFPFSALTRERLETYVRAWIDAVEISGSGFRFQGETRLPDLDDVSFTLATGRAALPHRLAVVAADWRELRQGLLAALDPRQAQDGFRSGTAPQAAGTAVPPVAAASPPPGSREEALARAERWVLGAGLAERKAWFPERRRKVSLPPYPFAREIHRVASSLPPAAAADRSRVTVLLTKRWRVLDLQDAAASRSGRVIVLATERTARLAARLFRGSATLSPLVVVQGRSFGAAAEPADYYREEFGDVLYREAAAGPESHPLIGVLDISALDGGYEASSTLERGKIRLLQRLIGQDGRRSPALMLVTHNLLGAASERPSLQGARLAGLFRMLSAEYPTVGARVVDVDGTLRDPALPGRIEAEFLSVRPGAPAECRWRLGKRQEASLEAVPTADAAGPEPQARGRGYSEADVILITGGTRGIGLAIAERLCERGARNLVLLGREALPDATEWASARLQAAPMAEKLRRLGALRARGVRIHYSHAPLTDAEALLGLVRTVAAGMGPVTEVYHCAGLSAGTPVFCEKSMDGIEAVCAPKVAGLVNLHAALAEAPLRRFVLFSSLTSLSPVLAAGLADYAMANAFMDAYAAHQAGRGRACFASIQWPAWGETGMSADAAARSTAYADLGLEYLETREGLDLLETLPVSPDAVAAPCRIRGDAFAADRLLRRAKRPDAPATGKGPASPAGGAASPAPGAAAADPIPGASREAVRAWILETFACHLRIPPGELEDDKPFADYGIESVRLAQLSQALQKRIEASLPPSLLLEHASIRALTDYFLAEHAGASAALVAPRPAAPARPADPARASASPDAIAVVGISCRFPGAPDKEAFWALLSEGRKAIARVPGNRWTPEAGRDDLGGWIEGVEWFDPRFFRIDARDAAVMDPQARVLLEESLRAACDAGYEARDLAGRKVGVFIGGRSQAAADPEALLSAPNPILGVGQNYLAANISRFFNLSGPSLVLDTACSSGLAALQIAVDALRDGRIESALAGASSLLLDARTHDLFARRNLLSRSGEFRIFEKESDGEVLGEGAGMVMLMRLGDAVAQGRRIYGVIRSIAVNNDGQTLGPGSPSIKAQKQVMQEALERAGLARGNVGYLEVSGGGSLVVDSIEIKALSEVYGLQDRGLPRCRLGSVKPSIGHLLLASGMAGFIRCVLSVHHGRIPPYLSTRNPFEFFDFASSRLVLNRSAEAWEAPHGGRRIAAQSCFPDGGTNCHVIVEEFVPGEGYRASAPARPVPPMEKMRFPLIREARPAAAVPPAGPGRDRAPILENAWGAYEEIV